jgi:hypothetical protein
MSGFDESMGSSAEQRQVDRLVDGELSEADRRVLLLQLEHEPDGWRRCALAFLEAQCWKAELGPPLLPDRAGQAGPTSGQPVANSSPQPAGLPTVSSQRAAGWQRGRQIAATLLTISACLLIAIFIGMGLRGNGSGELHGPGSPVKEAVLTEPNNGPLGNESGAPGGWELVTFPAADSADGRTQTCFVPAQRREALDQSMLTQAPDALPPEVQRAFEDSGHQIVQTREIVEQKMKDGRRLVVPVDNVEIHYVGRQSN